MCIFINVIDFQNQIQQSNVYSKKIIGIDYGSHKIGIALSDENRCIAFKQEILIGDWNNIEQTVDVMFKICKKYNSNVIVFGFPKKLDGSLSENCKKIIQIAKLLDKEYTKSNKNISILLFDERFTTKATTSIFNTRIAKNFNSKKEKNKQQLDDAGAACIILNNVLTVFNKK